jgi:hypothetical protein
VAAIFFIPISGWIACFLIGFEAVLPYAMRRGRFSAWLGDLLLILTLLHSAVSMLSGGLRGLNTAGIWLATTGVLALLLQTILGLFLLNTSLRERRAIRRCTYWLMFVVVVAVGVHVWLNGQRSQGQRRNFGRFTISLWPNFLMPGMTVR